MNRPFQSLSGFRNRRLASGRRPPWALLCFIAGCALTAVSLAAADSSRELQLEQMETWAPLPEAAPVTSKDENGEVRIDSNRSRLCSGGWQFLYSGLRGGQGYRIATRVRHTNLEDVRDSLVVMVLWDAWDPNQKDTGHSPWNYLLPLPAADGAMDFEGVFKAPEGATRMTVRYIFRWSARGETHWTSPRIEPASLPELSPVTISVVSATSKTLKQFGQNPKPAARKGLPEDVGETVTLWEQLVRKACHNKPQLILTPETVIAGKHLRDGAVEVPGPATEPFQAIAKEHRTHIVLGVRERERDAVYNSAVLISPDGAIRGVYHKVHLAIGEGLSGELPGRDFPVFNTDIGRIGCLICMDTTVCESARMMALHGAGIICMPIMGDLRASRWTPGPSSFDESSWQAIMRTRAIDNQVCMVVARNAALGSCIINRKGDILAWNDGSQEVITAMLPAEDGFRLWNGGDFREVTFLLRRPQLYQAYTDQHNLGPLKAPAAKNGPLNSPRSNE